MLARPVWHSFQSLLRHATDLVIPARCAVCGVITAGDAGFCRNCWGQMRFIAPPCCASCGIPLAFENPVEQQCACIAQAPRHDGIQAVVAYCDISRQIPMKLKYGGRIGLADVIARQLLRYVPENREDCVIIPVPLHWTRLWSRGFNQAALIGHALHRHTGIPVIPDALVRKKRTGLLRGKSARERKRELVRAIAANPRHEPGVENRHILLVDDVYTSGATSDACVRILKQAGAKTVAIYCWARVLREELPGTVMAPVVGDAGRA